MTDVTQQLLEMLAANNGRATDEMATAMDPLQRQADEAYAAQQREDAQTLQRDFAAAGTRLGPRMATSEESSAWCRENPGYCTGRGPTGRLRNFRAMNRAKIDATYAAILAEQNDPEALAAIELELQGRAEAEAHD